MAAKLLFLLGLSSLLCTVREREREREKSDDDDEIALTTLVEFQALIYLYLVSTIYYVHITIQK